MYDHDALRVRSPKLYLKPRFKLAVNRSLGKPICENLGAITFEEQDGYRYKVRGADYFGGGTEG